MVLDWYSKIMVTSFYRTNIFPRYWPNICKEGCGARASQTCCHRCLDRAQSGAHPIASFLFLCLPGCGRTVLAKSIAELFFDAKDMLTELNMVKCKCAEPNPVSDEDEYGYI